jgi:hypothetical protein
MRFTVEYLCHVRMRRHLVEIEAASADAAVNIARRHSQIEGRVLFVLPDNPSWRSITRMVPSNSLPQCHRSEAA